MKKIFGLALITMLVMVLAGCDDEVIEKEPETRLKIQNESSRIIRQIYWNNKQINFYNIDPGRSSSSVYVQPGTGYIYFLIGYESYRRYRTVEAVTINKGEEYLFVFTDNTLFVAID